MNKNSKKLIAIVISSLFLSVTIGGCNSNSEDEANGGGSVTGLNFLGQSGGGGSTNAVEQTWRYTYTANHLLETATDPNGGVTRYDYDEYGRVIKITNPLKQMISLSDYDSNDKPRTIINANGVTTKLTYTEDGWLQSSTTDGAVTSLEYDKVGNVTKLVAPDNTAVSYVYNTINELMQIKSASGTMRFRWLAGKVIAIDIDCALNGLDGNCYSQQRGYDDLNRLSEVVSTIKSSKPFYVKAQYFTYDNNNDLITSTDGKSNKTSFGWDELQRLSQVTDAKNGYTKYSYDNTQSISNPSGITDAKGSVTSYVNNGLDNLLKLISPDSGTHNYTAYDANGNLLSQADAKGQLVSYSYDALNRPKTINYSGDAGSNTIFTYDSGSNAVGRLTKVQTANSSNSYYYDARGNTLSDVQRIAGADYTIGYGYDKADNLTNIVYPSKAQVAYIYTSGQLSKILVNGKAINVTHLPFGPINNIEFPNGVSEKIGYNTDYSIKSINVSNDLMNREYSYYPNGDIKAITGVNTGYDYDQLSSLTKADNQAYTNDKVSNRTQATISGTTTTYTIATGSNRLDTSKVGTVETKYDYDSAGNMIKAGSSNYVYDGLNRLKSVTLDTAKNGDTLATYQYNAYSQRILKDVDGKQTIFIYNSAGQLLEEYNKAQNTTRDYVYADGMLVAIMENGINVYVITDHLNAPQMLLDSTGRNIWSATYDAFGKATITGNLKLNLRADGQYNDDETGLYYNWYRYYNPSLGRYITSDPMGLQAGMNTYIYVNGNPINYTDPQGLFAPILIGMAVSGGSEIFAQYLQHGGNISNWNMRNIAVATVFGIIPGGASMYSVKMGFGFLKTFAADGLSSGVATLLQSQTINRCEDKQTSFGDDLITFQQGNTYGVLGNATTEFVGYTRYKPLTKTIISNVLIGAQPPLIEKVVGKDGRGISK